MNELKKFLMVLLVLATSYFPEEWLRELDRYFREERHGDKVGAVSGYAVVARLREERYREAQRSKGQLHLALA